MVSVDPAPQPTDVSRSAFLNLAGAFEGGVTLLALALAWLLQLDLWAVTSLDLAAFGQSILALAPLLAGFALTYSQPVGPLKEIKRFLLDNLGPLLAVCTWYDLILLAGLAGLGEELLFRGVLQLGLDRWLGFPVGLVVASVVFGVVHAVTPAYALLAGLIGAYLGSLLYLLEPANLVVPMVVHAVYDLIAFWIVRRDYRRLKRGSGFD